MPLFIFSDMKRFKQVLFNLLGNAVKFTFKGGITLNVNYRDEKLITKVIDTGVGMAR